MEKYDLSSLFHSIIYKMPNYLIGFHRVEEVEVGKAQVVRTESASAITQCTIVKCYLL
jgi:hypothetical protein